MGEGSINVETAQTPHKAAEVSGGLDIWKERSGYKDLIYGESILLLRKYLPEAVPQEPTEVLLYVGPQYLGKFRGKHYLVAEGMRHYSTREYMDAKQKGVVPPEVPSDLDEPERISAGRGEYSLDTWLSISALVHELIHQRQAEVSKLSVFELSSQELEKADLNNMLTKQSVSLLKQSHRQNFASVDRNSLFFSVIEGMALLGEYYVMGRLAQDLMAAGDNPTAERIERVRKDDVRMQTVEFTRELRKEARKNPDEFRNFPSNYREGLNIMRGLYKQFGMQELPNILKQVDLDTCLNITKGSSQYQQIMEDPRLLPGLGTLSKS